MIRKSNDETRVVAIGLGASTPIGRCALSTAAAVRAGIAMFEDHSFMIDREGEPFVVSKSDFLDDQLPVSERIVRMAVSAVTEALLPLAGKNLSNIPVLVGLPSSRPGLGSDIAQSLIEALLSEELPATVDSEIRVLPNGHSAGMMAMQAGCELIKNREAEICLVGGVDSYIDPETLEWIEECGQLHNGSNAWGFIPGEAACFNLICSQEFAERNQMDAFAEVVAIETAKEANLIKTETVCIGEGLTEAVQSVLEHVDDDKPFVDFTICDQNGETYRGDEFGFMVSRTNQHFVDSSDFDAPADCWGDVGAASGPLFLLLVCIALQKKYNKGNHTLLWTSSESGERSAAIISTDIQQA